MKFAYEDLSDDQFEVLIVLLCQRLLGIAVQGFAKGPDGGRDAKFIGTAELHPSKAAPWVGTVIVQAKHTNGYNRSFSELDFYSTSSSNTVVGKEVPRIKKLREAKQLDHYMLFANRRLTGNSETEIRDHIAAECGVPAASIYLCGLEQLELWLKRFPEVAQEASLDAVDSPLIVSPDDLAEVVQALARQKNGLTALLDDPPTVRVTYEEKNALNNMTAAYAKVQRRKYLKETAQIRIFLAAPENIELLRMYESVVDEFQLKILAKRKDYQTFDEVMEYLVDLLFNRDPVLRQHAHKRLTRAILFYMYWNCDIGEVDDASANQTLTP
ncbi:ABC-three component system protein [Type-D symbiont of Plautia stali]|uniref:ABC-three component system protein n=1 Tax=Type-D symbiont of Plautia stali TaxID=1560356 RepID=UPI00073E1F7B|nr:ABC-three component system protein [Type-D symbiont of Plautia stali]